MNTRLRLLAALSLALVAAACGMFSGSRAPVVAATDASASSLVVLYHVRLGDTEAGFTNHNVYLNGTRVGRLNPGEEMRLQVGLGVTELAVQPELPWLGSPQRDPLKYSIETAKGVPTRYLRYRTASGQARMTPVAGTVLADRELGPVSEQDYNTRN